MRPAWTGRTTSSSMTPWAIVCSQLVDRTVSRWCVAFLLRSAARSAPACHGHGHGPGGSFTSHAGAVACAWIWTARNLISTDDNVYSLLLLCWNPKKWRCGFRGDASLFVPILQSRIKIVSRLCRTLAEGSPIHDHPGLPSLPTPGLPSLATVSGQRGHSMCWFRTMMGVVHEERYVISTASNSLVHTSHTAVQPGSVAYIDGKNKFVNCLQAQHTTPYNATSHDTSYEWHTIATRSYTPHTYTASPLARSKRCYSP